MKRIVLFLFFWMPAYFCANAQMLQKLETGLIVDKIVDKTIYFTNGQKFETPLFNLRVLGQLYGEKKLPFLILAGRDCGKCNAPDQIFIHSPSDGPIDLE